MEKTYIPYIKINPNFAVIYSQYEGGFRDVVPSSWKESAKTRMMFNLLDNESDGVMSKKSSKAVKLAVNWLEHLSKNQKVFCPELNRDIKFKLNFITLTLPVSQISGYCDNYGNYFEIDNAVPFISDVLNEKGIFDFHYSDDFIKKELLNHFLVILRREFKVHNYIWRAESQKNGNIHFHITLNKYIWLKDLRNAWNRVLAKTDMIKKYHQKFSGMSYSDYYAYRKSTGNPNSKDIQRAYNYGIETDWNDPNTTDIHAVWKIKNIAAYLCEYMSKNNSKYRKISGFLWRSSMLLAKLKAPVEIICGRLRDEIDHLMTCHKNRVKQTDWATILTFSIRDLKFMLKNSVIVELFRKYRDSVFNDYEKKYQIIFE